MNRRKWLLALLLVMLRVFSFAQQPDPIEHVWYNEEQSAKVQVYKAVDGKYYGKIVWLKVPLREGKPKTDYRNPKESHKSDPLLGLMVLKGFRKTGDDKYEDGTIYDPNNGKTYSCTIVQKGNKLDVRGYIGISLLGRTTVWTLAD